MLRVGIHENVFINKTEINDKGSLVIGMKVNSGGNDLFSALNENSDDGATTEESGDFMFFQFNITDWQGEPLETPKIVAQIQEFKAQLFHILKNYIPEDQITFDSHQWDGTNITSKSSQAEITTVLNNEEMLRLIYNNIAEYFVNTISPYVNSTEHLMRLLLVRQSKAKHFPTFRKRWLSTQPFMESMTVPKEQSKLKYSKWEIDNGYNNPDKIDINTDSISEEEAESTDKLFNK